MRLSHFEGVFGKRDQFQIDPRTLKVRPDFNIRDLTTPVAREKLDTLKAQIAAEGVLEALEIEFDGEIPWINEGHRRHLAVMELIAEGHDFKTIPCIQERQGTDAGKRMLHMLMRKKEDYEPQEYAKGIARLVNVYGWDRGELAKVLGCTKQTIDNHLKTEALPAPIKEHVAQGDISATLARQIAKGVDPKVAEEMIKANLAENKKFGVGKRNPKKPKVTAGSLKRDKAKPEQKAKTDLAPRPVTSFFQGLTPAQQEQALAYDGPENIGPESEPAPRTMADFGEGKPPPPRVQPSGPEYPGFVTIQPNQPTGRALKDILAALKPFADLCAEFDANEKLDDDIVEVFFSDIKRAWKAYTAATGGSEAEAA